MLPSLVQDKGDGDTVVTLVTFFSASFCSGQEEVLGVPAAALELAGDGAWSPKHLQPLHLPQVGCLPPFFLLPQTCLLRVFKDNERTYKA